MGGPRRRRQPRRLFTTAGLLLLGAAAQFSSTPLAGASFLARCAEPDAALFESRHCKVDYMTTNTDAAGGDANIDAALGILEAGSAVAAGSLASLTGSDAECLAALRGLLCPAVFRVCVPTNMGVVPPPRLCSSLRIDALNACQRAGTTLKPNWDLISNLAPDSFFPKDAAEPCFDGRHLLRKRAEKDSDPVEEVKDELKELEKLKQAAAEVEKEVEAAEAKLEKEAKNAAAKAKGGKAPATEKDVKAASASAAPAAASSASGPSATSAGRASASPSADRANDLFGEDDDDDDDEEEDMEEAILKAAMSAASSSALATATKDAGKPGAATTAPPKAEKAAAAPATTTAELTKTVDAKSAPTITAKFATPAPQAGKNETAAPGSSNSTFVRNCTVLDYAPTEVKPCSTKGGSREYSYKLVDGIQCKPTDETKALEDQTKIALCPCPGEQLRNLSLPCGSDMPSSTIFYFSTTPVGAKGEVSVPAMNDCDRLAFLPDRKILKGKSCAAPSPADKAGINGWEFLQFLGDHKFRPRPRRQWSFNWLSRLFERQTKLAEQPAAAKFTADGTRIEVPLLSHLVAYGCDGGDACQGLEPWTVRQGELSFVPPVSNVSSSATDTVLLVGRAWADFKIKAPGESKAELLVIFRSFSKKALGGLKVFVDGAERMGPVAKQSSVIGYTLDLPPMQVHRIRLEYTFGLVETLDEASSEDTEEDDLDKRAQEKEQEGVWVSGLAVRNGAFAEIATPEGEIKEGAKPASSLVPAVTSAGALTTATPASAATTTSLAAAPPPPPPPAVPGDIEGDDDDDEDDGPVVPPKDNTGTSGGLNKPSDSSSSQDLDDEEDDPINYLSMAGLAGAGAVAILGAGYVAWKWSRSGGPVTYAQLNNKGNRIELNSRNGAAGGDESWGDWNWDDEDDEEDDMLHPRGER